MPNIDAGPALAFRAVLLGGKLMNTRFAIFALAAIGGALLAVAHPAQATTINIGAPYNVLSGATAVSSTTITPAFPASAAVDDLVRAVPPADQDHGLIFSNSDPSERLGLSGSFGIMRKIRIWTIPVAADNRIPSNVAVRSSLNSYAGGALIRPGILKRCWETSRWAWQPSPAPRRKRTTGMQPFWSIRL